MKSGKWTKSLASVGIFVAWAVPVVAQDPPLTGVLELQAFCDRPQHFDFAYVSREAESALRECPQPEDETEQAACRVLSAYFAIAQGRETEALQLLEAGGEGFAEIGDSWGEWVVLFLQAEIHHAKGRGREVRARLAEATGLLDRLQASGSPISHRGRELFVEVTGVPNSTLEEFAEEGGRIRPLLLRTASISTLALLGFSQSCDGDYGAARATGRRVAEVMSAGIDLYDESRMPEFISWVDEKSSRFDRALQGYTLSYQLALKRGNPERLASVALRLSQLRLKMGHADDALPVLEEALGRTPPRSWPHVLLLLEKGLVQARLGQVGESRRALLKAREAARSSGDAWQEVAVLVIGGGGFGLLGFLEDQVRLLEEAVRLLEGMDDPAARARLLEVRLLLMYAYGTLELQPSEEFQHSEIRRLAAGDLGAEVLRSAEIYRKLSGSKDDVRELVTIDPENASFWGKLAGLYEGLDEAEGREEELALVVDAFGTEAPELRELYRRGILEEDLGFVERWLERWADEGRLTHSRAGAPWQAAEKLAQLAVVDVVTERPVRGVERARRAISMMESPLESMDVDEVVAAMMDEEAQDVIRMAVWVLSQVDIEEAFVAAEKGRARTLRLALSERPPLRSEPSGAEAQVLKQIALLEATEAGGATNDGAEDSELAALRDEFLRLRLEARLSSSGDPRSPDPTPDLERLQEELLSADATLVTYYRVRDQLLIWVVTPVAVEMTQRSMPSTEQITEAIASLRFEESGCAGAGGTGRHATGLECLEGSPSDRLYDLLIAPIEAWLRGRHLIIVPTGPLHEVPFAALRNPRSERYLVEDFSLSLMPTAGALALSSEVSGRPRTEALVMGDSLTAEERLSGARREAVQVAALLGSEPLLGAHASEARLYESAASARLLHLATHGRYFPEQPYFSRILLSSDSEHDGSLMVHETLDRLDLRGVELVVLSGCETALGEVSRGDDTVSLSGSFLVAGSRAVVSTLWKVNDEASADLMVSFYRHLLHAEASPAEALRLAQLEVLASAQTSAPYFWAGFSVAGAPATVLRPLKWTR